MSNGTNTFVVSGNAGLPQPLSSSLSLLLFKILAGVCILILCPIFAETKSIADIAPSILKQLNQEQLAKLLAQQQASVAEGKMPGLIDDE